MDPLTICAPLLASNPYYTVCKVVVLVLLCFLAWENGKLRGWKQQRERTRKGSTNARNRSRRHSVARQPRK